MGTKEIDRGIYEMEARERKAVAIAKVFSAKGVTTKELAVLDAAGWAAAERLAEQHPASNNTKLLVVHYVACAADRKLIEADAIKEVHGRYGVELGESIAMVDGHTAHFVGIYSEEYEDDYGDLHAEWRLLGDDWCYWATVVNGVIYSAAKLEDLQDEYAGVKA